MSIVRAIRKQNKPAWRNGRRTRLKIWRWQHRMGSSPIAGTQWREAEPGVLFQESVRRGGKLHAEIVKNKSVRA